MAAKSAETPTIMVEEKHVINALRARVARSEEENLMLTALANQQAEEISLLREAIDALASQQDQASKTPKGKKK